MPTVVRRRILSVFCCRKAAAKASSPCLQGEPRGALSWRGGRLHQVLLSSRAVSLPQSFCALWARKCSSILRGSRGGYRRKGTELAQCMPQQLRPPEAGGPHPSRCSAKAQHRATFPKGKAKRCGGAPKAPSPNTHIQKSPAANAAGGLFRGIIPSSASDNGDGGGACDTCVCYRRGCTAQAR